MFDLFKKLKEDIYNDASNVDAMVMKVLSLAEYLHDNEFVEWAKNELYGYAEYKNIPSYRNVKGIVWVDTITRGNCPVFFRQGQEELKENLENWNLGDSIKLISASSSKQIIFKPYDDDIQILLNEMNGTNNYKYGIKIDMTAIIMIITSVKMKIREFVSKYEFSFIEEKENISSQIINNYIGNQFNNSNVQGNTFNSNVANQFDYEKALDFLKNINDELRKDNVSDENRQEIQEQLDEIKNLINSKKKPNRIISAINGVFSFCTGVAASLTANAIQSYFLK